MVITYIEGKMEYKPVNMKNTILRSISLIYFLLSASHFALPTFCADENPETATLSDIDLPEINADELEKILSGSDIIRKTDSTDRTVEVETACAIPQASVAEYLKKLYDYPHYKEYFSAPILGGRLLHQDGNSREYSLDVAVRLFEMSRTYRVQGIMSQTEVRSSDVLPNTPTVLTVIQNAIVKINDQSADRLLSKSAHLSFLIPYKDVLILVNRVFVEREPYTPQSFLSEVSKFFKNFPLKIRQAIIHH